MIKVHQSLNPILIRQYSDPFEMLITEISIEKRKLD